MGLSPPLEKIYHSFFIYLLFSGTEKRKKYSFPFLALCVAGQRIPRRRRCYEQGGREDFWRAQARPRGPLLCQPSRRCASPAGAVPFANCALRGALLTFCMSPCRPSRPFMISSLPL